MIYYVSTNTPYFAPIQCFNISYNFITSSNYIIKLEDVKS